MKRLVLRMAWCAALGVLVAGCSQTSAVGEPACGTGTKLVDEMCVGDCGAQVTCGTGTRLQDDTCVPESTSTAECGAGTRLVSGKCLPLEQDPTIAAFTAQTGLKTSFSKSQHTNQYWLVVTDLPQSIADGFTQSEGAMVGTGQALHLEFTDPNCSMAMTGDRCTVAIKSGDTYDDVYAQQHGCGAMDPTNSYFDHYVALFAWTNAVATPVICAAGGSVVFELESDTEVKVTFNVQFSDGTLWTDKVFRTPFQESNQ